MLKIKHAFREDQIVDRKTSFSFSSSSPILFYFGLFQPIFFRYDLVRFLLFRLSLPIPHPTPWSPTLLTFFLRQPSFCFVSISLFQHSTPTHHCIYKVDPNVSAVPTLINQQHNFDTFYTFRFRIDQYHK